MSNVSANFTLSAIDFARGVEYFHFLDESAVTLTGGNGSVITAFATGTTMGTWHSFQNADGQGDFNAVPNQGPGGLEWAVSGNINIPGSSQESTTWANNFSRSLLIPCVAQLRDGTYKYLGRVNPSGGAGMTSGQQGGDGHGIALTFQGVLAVNAPDNVTVTTNLDAITDP